MRAAVLGRLRRIGLFGELLSHVQVRLATLGRVRTFEAGEALFRQGKSYDHLVILLNGRVSLEWGGSDATRSRSSGELGPGSIVGNTDLTPGQISRATVTAIGKVEVLQLDYLALALSAMPYPESMPAVQAAVRTSLVDISAAATRVEDGMQ